MNELSIEKTMTVKEVAMVLNCTEQTIRNYCNRLFPDKIKNGLTTYLTEIEVTKIKLEMNENYSLKTDFEVRTKLEKNLIVRQAIQFLEEEKFELIEQNRILTEENQILTPKAIAFDVLMKTDDMMSITTAAKHFKLSQKKVFSVLRDKGYLTLSDLPTQKAINKDVLHLKETVCKDNKTRPQAVVKTNQLDNFYKAVK
jgi:phage antirepressor YoqD-like protein